MSSKNAFEIRALTMMNFSIPPSLSLLEIGQKYPNDYISFQNHQIIQISEPQGSLPALYEAVIKSNRTQQRCSLDSGAHITQSITIIGDSGKFWDSPAPVCFITFLQTKDFVPSGSENDVTRYEQLKDFLNGLFELSPTNASFALYYSYDFCDYILFSKGTTAAFHNEILWKLTMDNSSDYLCIRDSYTFYSFSIPYLSSENQQDFDDIPIMALSARISAYSSDALNDLIKGLNAHGISCERNMLFGRYDIELRTDDLSISQIRSFIQCVDKAFKKNNLKNAYAPFGGYEFMPFSASHDSTYTGRKPRRDPAFVKALEKLFIQSTDQIDDCFVDYVREAKQSMRELIRNGFSTEFILGTLPPFCAAIKNLSIAPYGQFETAAPILFDAQQIDNVQRVFYALNTLALCMMHGERRFIQAPAFGASYFDIPAKLFAYYAAVINRVKNCYKRLDEECFGAKHFSDNPWKKEFYQFLMVPDFREGIFVHPIEQMQVQSKQEHISIIYLSEEFFYDPLKAIYLIAQETAHYVGVRHRKDRAHAILHTISCVLICVLLYRNNSLTTSTLDDLYDGKSSAGLLAKCLTEKMLECYKNEIGNETEPYRFENIYSFLVWYDYGVGLFREHLTKESIIHSWARMMEATADADLRTRIERIQQNTYGQSVNFLSKMRENSDGNYYTNLILANKVAEAANNLMLEMGADNIKLKTGNQDLMQAEDWLLFDSICKNIISVFREAFADYRMIQVLGDGFDVNVYKELLKKLVPKDIDYDLVIRHDAVLSAAGYVTADFMFYSERGYIGNTQYLAIRGVKEYLNKCAASYNGPTMGDAIRVFSDTCHPEKQCQLILKELDLYMEQLVKESKR